MAAVLSLLVVSAGTIAPAQATDVFMVPIDQAMTMQDDSTRLDGTVKFYFGGPELPFGLPPTLKSLEAYLEMLKGVRANWFAATLGGDNLPMVPLIVSLGGHVRIGLEDFQYARAGQLSNPQLAERAAATIRAMGHEVATPDEARAMLEV